MRWRLTEDPEKATRFENLATASTEGTRFCNSGVRLERNYRVLVSEPERSYRVVIFDLRTQERIGYLAKWYADPAEEARATFADAGLTFADVALSRFLQLATTVQRCLEADPSGPRLSTKMVYDPEPAAGGMTSAFLYLDAGSYRKVEAVAFLRSGYIVLAPLPAVTDGFRRWVEEIKTTKGNPK